jgi:Sugar-transfer associated ATP-grasp
VLRMARTPGIVVDNFHAGGIAAQVDLDSGVVGRATDLGLQRDTQWFDDHPTTGARIAGRRIPMWQDVLDVARRAHRAFGDQIIVGWDVAVLEVGPQLIEGNKGPDFDIIQRTSRAPIGNARVGTLLAHHLRRALEEHPQAAGSSGADSDGPRNRPPSRALA